MKNIILIIIIFTTHVNAQKIIILDEASNLPIVGVSIKLKNNASFKGNYSNQFGLVDISNLNYNDTIIFEHFSYSIIELPKNKIKANKVTLSLNPNPLENINVSDSRINNLSGLSYIKTKRAEILLSQSAQLSDVLQKNMGVSIQSSQNGGGSPNFRGQEANRLLIVADGIPLNNTIYRSGHVQSSSIINPLFLEEVEILSGPAAVAYGNAAMAGALSLETRRPVNKSFTEVFQQYETSSKAVFTSVISNFILNNSINIFGGSIKSFGDLRMGGNRMHGYSEWGNENIISKNNIQKMTGYKQGDMMFKSLIKISNNNFLMLNTQLSTSSKINRFDKLNDLSNGEQKYKYWYYGPQNRFFQSIKLRNYSSSYFFDESTYCIAAQKIQESRHKQKNNALFLNSRKENLNIIDFTNNYFKKFKSFRLDYGVDVRYQKLVSRASLSTAEVNLFNTTRYPDGGTSVLNNAIYAHLTYDFYEKLSLLTGIRYNINSLSANFLDTTIIKLPFQNIKLKNNAVSSSFKLIYYYDSNFSINASISNGFRNPNTDDVGKIFSKDDITVIIPNNNLVPEKSIAIESGFDIKIKDKLSVTLSIYKTYIKDAIARREAQLNGLDSINYDGEMMKVIMNSNINSAEITGLSLGYKLNFTKRITHKSMLNILKGRTGLNTALAHIPPANINSELVYKYKHHSVYLSIMYNAIKPASEYDIGGIDNLEEATIIGNPSWHILNIKYNVKIDDGFSITTAINNLMDAHYKTFGSGLSASGRNFTLSLQTRL